MRGNRQLEVETETDTEGDMENVITAFGQLLERKNKKIEEI